MLGLPRLLAEGWIGWGLVWTPISAPRTRRPCCALSVSYLAACGVPPLCSSYSAAIATQLTPPCTLALLRASPTFQG